MSQQDFLCHFVHYYGMKGINVPSTTSAIEDAFRQLSCLDICFQSKALLYLMFPCHDFPCRGEIYCTE